MCNISSFQKMMNILPLTIPKMRLFLFPEKINLKIGKVLLFFIFFLKKIKNIIN